MPGDKERTLRALPVIVFLFIFLLPLAATAVPPLDEVSVSMPVHGNLKKPEKPIDVPNPVEVLALREKQRIRDRLSSKSLSAPARAALEGELDSLAKTGTDRVLAILVEFGNDTLTWDVGDTWDPVGKADTSESTETTGDCSKIITASQSFDYSGPVHNEIPRPESEADRSGESIWIPDFSAEWFRSFLFGDGVIFDYKRKDGSSFSRDFSGKSVRDFFEDMSGGRYSIQGDVIGWLKVPHSTFWYGADTCPGKRSITSETNVAHNGAYPHGGDARTLVQHALDAVNSAYPGFDWTKYDQDGDGIIDRLWIVHAGYGEEDGTNLLNRTPYGEGSLWSHSWSLASPYTVDAVNDISAGPYILMPENGGIGVFAHESGHNVGAMDLYAYDGGEASAGFWTTMADDWTGYPIGFQPPALDPYHLDQWG